MDLTSHVTPGRAFAVAAVVLSALWGFTWIRGVVERRRERVDDRARRHGGA